METDMLHSAAHALPAFFHSFTDSASLALHSAGTALFIILDPIRFDHHPALHRPPRHVSRFDMRFGQRLVSLFWAKPDDQRILPNADQHIAVE